MKKHIASLGTFKPHFTTSPRVAFPPPSKATTCSARLWHEEPRSGSQSPDFKSASYKKFQYSDKTRNAAPRSDRTKKDRPSWLDTGPGSDITVRGTVTEIDVPGSGTFPLYARVLLLQNHQYADYCVAQIFGSGT
jgi:hypothetical protein